MTSVTPSPALASTFRCPGCGERLTLDWKAGVPRCGHCQRVSGAADGILDFVTAEGRAAERAHYEAEYAQPDSRPHGATLAELAEGWTHPAKPVNRALARLVGNLKGQRVLLVGNGGSAQELHFLTLEPELLVFSDLSRAGVARVRDAHSLDPHQHRICFAALDALNLPFPDESLDVVYGNAIVHHLPDRERFLAEVVRVLRPGGRAVFMDDAYVPLWQLAKRVFLRPLLIYSHRRVPRSPEDVRHTMGGGFREDDLAASIRALGAEPWFERQGLAWYLWRRASLVLFPSRVRHLGEHPRVAGPLIALDERLGRHRFARALFIRLLWGLRKTESQSSAAR